MEKEELGFLIDFVEYYECQLIDHYSKFLLKNTPPTHLHPSPSYHYHDEEEECTHIDLDRAGFEAAIAKSASSIHSEMCKSAEEGSWQSELSLVGYDSEMQSKSSIFWDLPRREFDTSSEDLFNAPVNLSSSLNAGYTGTCRKRKVSCYEDALRILGVGLEGSLSNISITNLAEAIIPGTIPKAEQEEDTVEFMDKLDSLKLSRISSISHSDPEIHASPKLSAKLDHSLLSISIATDLRAMKSPDFETKASATHLAMKPKSPTQRKSSEPCIRGHLPETLEMQFKELMEGVITKAIEGSADQLQRSEDKENSEGLTGLNRLVVMLEQLNQARKDNRYWRKRCRYLENKFSCPGAIGASGRPQERVDLKDEELRKHREQMLMDYFRAKPLAKKKYSLASEMELKKLPSDPTKVIKTIEMGMKDDKMERKKSKKFQTKWEQVKKVFSSARQEALAKKEMTSDWASASVKPFDKRLSRTGRQHTIVGPLMLSDSKKLMPEAEEELEGNLDSPKSLNSELGAEAVGEETVPLRDETNKTDETTAAKNRLSLTEFPSVDSYAESTAKLQDILNFQKQQQFTINYPDVLQHEKGALGGTPKMPSTPSYRAAEHGADDQKQVQFLFPDPSLQKSESKRPKKPTAGQEISSSFLSVKQRDDPADHHFSDSDRYFSNTMQLPLGRFSKSDRGQLDQVSDSGLVKQHLKPGGASEESKVRSSGRATWERVKDLIQTRKGSFKRRRSKKQDSSLDVTHQRSAEFGERFPDMAEIIKTLAGKCDTTERELRGPKPNEASILNQKCELSFKKDNSTRSKREESKAKEDAAIDGKPQRKVSRSEENCSLPKSGSTPGLTEHSPMLSRSRSDKIRRDRSRSDEGRRIRGVVASLTSPMRRRADTAAQKSAEKRPLTRTQKRTSDSKRGFSSKDDQEQNFDSPARSTKQANTISLAEIYTCSALCSTHNIVNLSSSFRPSSTKKAYPKEDDFPFLFSDLGPTVSSTDDATSAQPMTTSATAIVSKSNLRVPMLQLAVSTESIQSTCSSGVTRASSTLSTNTPGLSPSYHDDIVSNILRFGVSVGSSFTSVDKSYKRMDDLNPHHQLKERPKSALLESFEVASMKPEDVDKDENNSADFSKSCDKETSLGLSRHPEDSETTWNKNPDIKESHERPGLSGNAKESSHLAPVDVDKAALLTRLVSASEILFRPIEEDDPGESAKEIYSRKSFLILKQLIERLIKDLNAKQIEAQLAAETPSLLTSLTTEDDELTSGETNQTPVVDSTSIRDLRSSSTQTSPTIETTLSMDKPRFTQESDGSEQFEEDKKLMKKIRILFKNMSKTRRFSDSVIFSPKLILQFPSSPHPSRENLASDPTPLKTNLHPNDKEFYSFLASFQHHLSPSSLEPQMRRIPARQTPYLRLQSQYDNVFLDTAHPQSATKLEDNVFRFPEQTDSLDLRGVDLKIHNIGIQITKSSEQDISNKEHLHDDKTTLHLSTEPFHTHYRTLSDSGISESVFYSQGSSRNQLSGQASTDLVQQQGEGQIGGKHRKRFLLPPDSTFSLSAKQTLGIDSPSYRDSPKLTIYTRASTSTFTPSSDSFVTVRRLKTAAELIAEQSHKNGQTTSPLTPPAVRCSYNVPHKNGRSKSHDYGTSQSNVQPKLEVVTTSSESDNVESTKKLPHVSSTPYIGKTSSIYTESLSLIDTPNLFAGNDQSSLGYLATLSEPLIYVDPSDGLNTKITLPSIYALNDTLLMSQIKGESISGSAKPVSASDPLNHKFKNVPEASLLSINSSDFFETRPCSVSDSTTKDDHKFSSDVDEGRQGPTKPEEVKKVHRSTSSDSKVTKRSEYPIDVVALDDNPTKPAMKLRVKSSGELEQIHSKKSKSCFSKSKPEKHCPDCEESGRRFLSSPKFLRLKFKRGVRSSVAEEEGGQSESTADKSQCESKKAKKRSRSLPRVISRLFHFFRRNKKRGEHF